MNEVHGRDAEAGRPETVERRWTSTALEMAEHGHPSLHAGPVLDDARERLADTAAVEARVPKGVDFANRFFRHDLGHHHALGDDDDREVLPLSGAAVQVLADLIQVDRHLGNQDEIGPACQPPGDSSNPSSSTSTCRLSTSACALR